MEFTFANLLVRMSRGHKSRGHDVGGLHVDNLHRTTYVHLPFSMDLLRHYDIV